MVIVVFVKSINASKFIFYVKGTYFLFVVFIAVEVVATFVDSLPKTLSENEIFFDLFLPLVA